MTLYIVKSDAPDQIERIDNVVEISTYRDEEIVQFAILDENGKKQVYRIEQCIVSLESN